MPRFLRTLPERGFRRRARAVAVLFCAVCLGLAVRLFFLQVRTDGFYADRAQGQKLRDMLSLSIGKEKIRGFFTEKIFFLWLLVSYQNNFHQGRMCCLT